MIVNKYSICNYTAPSRLSDNQDQNQESFTHSMLAGANTPTPLDPSVFAAPTYNYEPTEGFTIPSYSQELDDETYFIRYK